jgi:hypothetical protein
LRTLIYDRINFQGYGSEYFFLNDGTVKSLHDYYSQRRVLLTSGSRLRIRRKVFKKVPGIYFFVVFLVDSDPEGLARDGEFLLGNAGLEAERVRRRARACAADAALQTAVSDTKVVVLKATENDAYYST